MLASVGLESYGKLLHCFLQRYYKVCFAFGHPRLMAAGVKVWGVGMEWRNPVRMTSPTGRPRSVQGWSSDIGSDRTGRVTWLFGARTKRKQIRWEGQGAVR